jgi:hypothetical protein
VNKKDAGAPAREERAPAQTLSPEAEAIRSAAQAALNGHTASPAKHIPTETERLLEIERRRREAAALAAKPAG